METYKYPRIYTFIGIGLIASILLLGFGLFFSQPERALSSAPSGLQATVATSTLVSVSTTASILAATSTCSARIVTTATSSVMLSFSDRIGQTPTNTYGHWQPASTTVAYDSGIYGCDLMKVWSQGSQWITITETR